MEIYRCSSTRGIERYMPGSDDDDVPACEKHFWQGCCWLQNEKPRGMQIVSDDGQNDNDMK
jgi:hypothetical protein